MTEEQKKALSEKYGTPKAIISEAQRKELESKYGTPKTTNIGNYSESPKEKVAKKENIFSKYGIGTYETETGERKAPSMGDGSGYIKGALQIPIQTLASALAPILDLPANVINLISDKNKQTLSSKIQEVIQNSPLGAKNEIEQQDMQTLYQALAILSPEIQQTMDTYSTGRSIVKEAKGIEKTIPKIQKELTPKERELAIKQGRGETNILGETKIKPSPRDEAIAGVTKDIVKSKKPEENIAALQNEIKTTSENLTAKLEKDPKIFNTKTIESKLTSKAQESSSIFGTDAEINSYNKVKDVFIEELNKQPKTTAGLYKARIATDQRFKNTFKNIFSNESNARSVALKDLRNTVNEIIEMKAPGAGYLSDLKSQSLMYDAIDNIAYNAARGKNLTGTQTLLQNIKKGTGKVIKTGIGAAIGGKIIGDIVSSDK